MATKNRRYEDSAKLRGKHYSVETAKKQIIKWMDETFPLQAPHHLVIMTDDDYKKYQKSEEFNKWSLKNS